MPIPIRQQRTTLTRHVDVIYDFWGREDIIWRRFATKASVKISKKIHLGNPDELAFVIDDSLKSRLGKKVGGPRFTMIITAVKPFRGSNSLNSELWVSAVNQDGSKPVVKTGQAERLEAKE